VKPCWSSSGSFGGSIAEEDLIRPPRSVLGHKSPMMRTWNTDRINCLSPQQPRGQHTGQNSLKVEVPGPNVSTSTLNRSFSDSRPDKLTLISLAGSGFGVAIIRYKHSRTRYALTHGSELSTETRRKEPSSSSEGIAVVSNIRTERAGCSEYRYAESGSQVRSQIGQG